MKHLVLWLLLECSSRPLSRVIENHTHIAASERGFSWLD